MDFEITNDFLIQAIKEYYQHYVLIKNRYSRFVHVKRVQEVVSIYAPCDDDTSTPYQALMQGLRSEYTTWEQVGHKSVNQIRLTFEIFVPHGPKRMEVQILDYDFIHSFRKIVIKQMYVHLS